MPDAWRHELAIRPLDENGKRMRLRDVVDRWGPEVAQAIFEKVAYAVVRGVSPTKALKDIGVRRGIYQRLRMKQPQMWDDVWDTALRGYTGEAIQVEVFKTELAMLDVRRSMLARAKEAGDAAGVGYDFKDFDKQDMEAFRETTKAAGILSKHVTALVQKKIDLDIDLNVRKETRIDVTLHTDIAQRLDSLAQRIAAEISGAPAGGIRSIESRTLPDDSDGEKDSETPSGRPALTGSVLQVQDGSAGRSGEG